MRKEYVRTNQIRKWQGGPIYNTDDLLQPDNGSENNHLNRRQIGQNRRWDRVRRAKKYHTSKREVPMEENQKSKAGMWLQRLENHEKGDSLDENAAARYGLAAAAVPAAYYGTGPALKHVAWPLTKWAAGKAAEIPGISHGVAATKYAASLPGKAAAGVGSALSSAASGIGSAASAVGSGIRSDVPLSVADTSAGVLGNIAQATMWPLVAGYSVGALIGALSRAAIHMKYRVDKGKLYQIMNIPKTTDPSDIAGALDWFGFTQQGAMIRSGKGDPIIGLQNILRALNGDRHYVNPATGRRMQVKQSIPLFDMAKKAIAISNLHASLQQAHINIKEFDFSFMIQERFKWETEEDYTEAHEPIEEEVLLLALAALSAALGTIQFGKFQSTLNGIESKVKRLSSAKSETDALRLISQIVDGFGLNIGKLVFNKKADPLLAVQMVLDYLEGNRRTRNPQNGYKMATPTRALPVIPFGAVKSVHELLGYIDEIQELIKRLERER